jgi:hypothetical protein
MKEAFITKRFGADARNTIEHANAILEEYRSQGLVLTLRQLYYQFVSRNLIENKQQAYKRLGDIMADARLAGLVDWDMIEDRGRVYHDPPKWGTPADIIEACSRQYREDLWSGQDWRPEVWVEKEALIGVIERPCLDLRVPYFACKGYNSVSVVYEAGQRFRRWIDAGQTPVVFHLGDHDPSGIAMTGDNRERLSLVVGEPVKVERLALNMDQVERYQPPPNFAKTTDTRAEAYIAKFGNQSWELDALEPNVIEELIRDAINPLINRRKWKAALDIETQSRVALETVSDKWDDVREYVS